MRKNHSKIVCIKLVHLPYFMFQFLKFTIFVVYYQYFQKRAENTFLM